MNTFIKLNADLFANKRVEFIFWLNAHYKSLPVLDNELARIRLSGGPVMVYKANKKGIMSFHPEMYAVYLQFLKEFAKYKESRTNPIIHGRGFNEVPAGQYTIVIDSISNLVLEQGANIGKISKQEILQDLIAKHINEYVRKLA